MLALLEQAAFLLQLWHRPLPPPAGSSSPFATAAAAGGLDCGASKQTAASTAVGAAQAIPQARDELLGSTNAAQDDLVYKVASDVYADQTTEIERMQKMLATVPPSKESRP